MAGKKKTVLIILLVLVLVIAGMFLGRWILLSHIQTKLEEQVYRLRDAGYVVSYDSIRIDVSTNSVEVFGLSIKNDIDSILCDKRDFISARYIRAEGFRVLPLLMKRHLDFREIVLDSSRLVINETHFTRDTVKRRRSDFMIFVETIRMPALRLEYFNSKSCKFGNGYARNLTIRDFRFAMLREENSLFVDLFSFSGDSIAINLPDHNYRLAVASVTFKPSMGIFDLDTLSIVPVFGKVAFGKQKGFETDRVEGTVPYVNIYGLSASRGDSLIIEASKLTTQLHLKVFRDKRLPFRGKFKNLPLDALNKLPVGVRIDSIVLNQSFVSYEEFPDGADSSGVVFFDDLYATIQGVNNMDYTRKGNTVLIATAKLMGEGLVKVKAVCPWNTQKRQHVHGTVRGLPMQKLNEMLEPAIQVRAESGQLDELYFDFYSGSLKAKGTVALRYHDLKLTTFRNNGGGILDRNRRDSEKKKVRKATFKTFLINTFVIRKNMDSKVPEEKRTGDIDFERDVTRSVFNYWWKSILSGIKSAYNLEKLNDKKINQVLGKKDDKRR